MITKIDTSGTIENLQALLDEIQSIEGIQSIVILAGNNSDFTKERLDPVLQNVSVPLIGGMFCSIIYQHEVFEEGTILLGLSKKLETIVISNLSNEETNFDNQIESIIGNKSFDDIDTMFVFTDGYATQIGSLTESLFNIFGVSNNFIGGGAGYYHPDKEMKAKPCVITNKGIAEDAAVLGLINLNSKIGVKHGWGPITDSFRVTETDGKKIKSIDWEPALDIYCRILEESSGVKVNRNNFFEIGKHYSLGLIRMGSQIIVREPIAIDEKSLVFTVPVPNESFVHVLKGNKESMVEAAREAMALCLEKNDNMKDKALFVVDCVSRYYYHGSDFKDELNAINYGNIPTVGVLSIGEIANKGNNYIELYNKTIVVGLIEA